MKMLGTLWLRAEQSSDSEAVLHPATPDHVRVALEFLEASSQERRETAIRLQLLLDQQRQTPPMSRRAVPCVRPHGLRVLLPWRLAAWLVRALGSSANTVDDLRRRLSRWLTGLAEAQACGEENKQAVAQPSLLG